jgi:hypothetical protein
VALSILGPVKPGPMVIYCRQCRTVYIDPNNIVSLIEELDKVCATAQLRSNVYRKSERAGFDMDNTIGVPKEVDRVKYDLHSF